MDVLFRNLSTFGIHAVIVFSLSGFPEALPGRYNISCFYEHSYGQHVISKINQCRLYDLSAMALLGAGNSFTKVAHGVGIFLAKTTLTPTGFIGYRHQKSSGGFIFRTGMGYPDIFYIGLGFGF